VTTAATTTLITQYQLSYRTSVEHQTTAGLAVEMVFSDPQRPRDQAACYLPPPARMRAAATAIGITV